MDSSSSVRGRISAEQKKAMVMGTAAKFISRRLFSSAWNFREEAKTVKNLYGKANSHHLDKHAQFLLEKVQICQTEMKSLRDSFKRASDVQNSIKTTRNPIVYSTMFGYTCVMFWYYWGQIAKVNKEIESVRKKRQNFKGAGATSLTTGLDSIASQPRP